MPNPIDTDLFKPTNDKEKGKAFHISYGVDEEAKKIANEMNLQLTR
ncbi:MAG: hypothetical protein QXK74_01100 [Candidatus Nitrosocaldaceae archaeon]